MIVRSNLMLLNILRFRIKASLFLSQATMGVLPNDINVLANRMNAVGETRALAAASLLL